MENLRTYDSVMEFVNYRMTNRLPIDVNQWLEVAQALNRFLEEEQNKLFLLEKQVAQEKMKFLELGESVSKVKVRLEASELTVDARKQKARVERAIELIRIAKKQATLTNDIINSN